MKHTCRSLVVMASLMSVGGRAMAQAPSEAPREAVDDVAAEDHEAAQISYQRHSIHFGTDHVPRSSDGTPVNTHQWTVYQGELDQPMAAADFYQAVHRPDLYEKYQGRRTIGTALSGAGLGMVASGAGLVIYGATRSCGQSVCAFSTVDGVGMALGLTGAVMAVIGGGVRANAQPIDEAEAKTLADQYNQQLRGQLGLPVVGEREQVLHDVRVAPFAGASGGGLALGGKF